MTRVGILGYQGCIEPHEAIYKQLGVACCRVRTPTDLLSVDRLIIPGGESTTMLKFLKQYGMISPIREFSKKSRVWGICAGAILVATEVTNPDQDSLKLIDIAAHRNYYGSQRESFTATITIDLIPSPIETQFIRAPLLSKIATGSSSQHPLVIHSYHQDRPVFFSQGNVWACSFHAELGNDSSLHRKFLEI